MPDERVLQAFTVDRLRVRVYRDREAAGHAAASLLADGIRTVAADGAEVPMVFASAPSQDEVLAALAATPDLPWAQVHAFHLDEYLGLPADAPQAFGRYLLEHLFDHVNPGGVHLIDATADADAEAQRYGALLRDHPLVLACIGIGENGHIAFNEPGADPEDPEPVRVVALDETSRRQQVNDGCFADLAEVPTQALTLTIPAILAARRIVCVVPAASKAEAVRRALEDAVGPDCPASVLRRHPDATLFLDPDAASRLAPRDEAPRDEEPRDEAPRDEAPRDEEPRDEEPR